MKIEILYFGRPGEQLKITQEAIDLPSSCGTLAALLAWLKLRGELWEQALAEQRVRCAVNQEFARFDAPIKAGDEVAIFSPLSGG